MTNQSLETESSDIERSFLKQLEKKGIEQCGMPLFIKDLSHSLSVNDPSDLSLLNNRLNVLGWLDFELDYHTFQLAKACLENQ